ncbi:hypothetical protein J4Q44_G00072570 [Coregonus suidteri]|uniref:Uncharacterized protein n=1 Tax=Coregonus suidteri TaxID=861788 RepID=A0AAN8MEU0_9TELE
MTRGWLWAPLATVTVRRRRRKTDRDRGQRWDPPDPDRTPWGTVTMATGPLQPPPLSLPHSPIQRQPEPCQLRGGPGCDSGGVQGCCQQDRSRGADAGDQTQEVSACTVGVRGD